MKNISEENIVVLREELKNLPIEAYFDKIQKVLESVNSLDNLTELFTIEPYTERKPYLIRRTLVPVDSRFEEITIVYNFNHNVGAIVWDFKISLNELISWFGLPIIHNELHTNTTAFAFKGKNSMIEIIKTRYHDWLTVVESTKEEELSFTNEEGIRLSCSEIRFSFLQISLNIKD